MPRGRPKQFELQLSEIERAQLAAPAAVRRLRAQLGDSGKLGVSEPLVALWRRRYRDMGLLARPSKR